MAVGDHSIIVNITVAYFTNNAITNVNVFKIIFGRLIIYNKDHSDITYLKPNAVKIYFLEK